MSLTEERIKEFEQSICEKQNELKNLEEELGTLLKKQYVLLEIIDYRTKLKQMLIDHPELLNDLD